MSLPVFLTNYSWKIRTFSIHGNFLYARICIGGVIGAILIGIIKNQYYRYQVSDVEMALKMSIVLLLLILLNWQLKIDITNSPATITSL